MSSNKQNEMATFSAHQIVSLCEKCFTHHRYWFGGNQESAVYSLLSLPWNLISVYCSCSCFLFVCVFFLSLLPFIFYLNGCSVRLFGRAKHTYSLFFYFYFLLLQLYCCTVYFRFLSIVINNVYYSLTDGWDFRSNFKQQHSNDAMIKVCEYADYQLKWRGKSKPWEHSLCYGMFLVLLFHSPSLHLSFSISLCAHYFITLEDELK